MIFDAPYLPYAPDALEQHGISAASLCFHLDYQRGCHQQLLMAQRRKLLQSSAEVPSPDAEDAPERVGAEERGPIPAPPTERHRAELAPLGMSVESFQALEELLRARARGAILLYAAQVWAHQLFWASMSPAGGQPSEALRAAIEARFTSLEGLHQACLSAAEGQLGAAWLYLCAREDGELRLLSCVNHETPLARGSLRPLLCCDLWQHAYQLEEPATRSAQVERWWSALNWERASASYEALL